MPGDHGAHQRAALEALDADIAGSMSISDPVTAALPVVGGDHVLNRHSPGAAKIREKLKAGLLKSKTVLEGTTDPE